MFYLVCGFLPAQFFRCREILLKILSQVKTSLPEGSKSIIRFLEAL